MKKITLKQLKLLNFKGLRDKTISFGPLTNIYGDNGTGKTSIFDAFLWLFFGKDSTDRKDFEIKTLDANNKPFHKMSHEVSAIINVNGDDVTIRRTYKENWPTKKGTATETFSGHTTNFYWNDVPLNETEYKKKIAFILDESLFKLVTNTGYFNSMKWQDRRQVLEQIAGTITNDMVFDAIMNDGNKESFEALIKALNNNKSLQEYRNEIANKKKLIRDEKELLPSRIDEAKRSLPDFVNYSAIEENIASANKDLAQVEAMISDKNVLLQNKQHEKTAKLKKMHELSSAAQKIEFEERNKVQLRKRERDQAISNNESVLSNKKQSLSSLVRDINNNESQKKKLADQQQELRNKWAAVDAEKLEFKIGEFHCPTCKREYDATNVEAKKEELTKNFNQSKSTRLTDIKERGVKLGEEVKIIDTFLISLNSKRIALEQEITSLEETIAAAREENYALSANDEQAYKDAMESHTEYISLTASIAELNAEINAPIDVEDNSELISKKRSVISLIDTYKEQLAGKGQREKIEKRIMELQTQESEMANELAKLEGIEYSIMQFEKSKMDMLETRVNSMFKIVKFKMFETQINGGETPCCITLINGVPFQDANTASKIQAGLDIINTLCRHHNISAPIFIDNRESCFVIPESESQIVSLIASEQDKQLRIVQAA